MAAVAMAEKTKVDYSPTGPDTIVEYVVGRYGLFIAEPLEGEENPARGISFFSEGQISSRVLAHTGPRALEHAERFNSTSEALGWVASADFSGHRTSGMHIFRVVTRFERKESVEPITDIK